MWYNVTSLPLVYPNMIKSNKNELKNINSYLLDLNIYIPPRYIFYLKLKLVYLINFDIYLNFLN